MKSNSRINWKRYKFKNKVYISKLVENKTIKNSTEALIYRNKAKAMVTGFIAADKLGFLGENDVQNVINDAI